MRALLLALALAPSVCHAADWWATVTFMSYHFERRNYNEENLGLGAEYHHNQDWRGAFGFYENSYYRRTYYAMAVWMPWHEDRWSFGAATGIATGYQHYPVFVVVPTISYEGDGAGVNFGITPAFVGVQLKFRFD